MGLYPVQTCRLAGFLRKNWYVGQERYLHFLVSSELCVTLLFNLIISTMLRLTFDIHPASLTCIHSLIHESFNTYVKNSFHVSGTEQNTAAQGRKATFPHQVLPTPGVSADIRPPSLFPLCAAGRNVGCIAKARHLTATTSPLSVLVSASYTLPASMACMCFRDDSLWPLFFDSESFLICPWQHRNFSTFCL